MSDLMHKRRINRLLTNAAVRVILKRGTTRLASVLEISAELTPSEVGTLVRSAHALAQEKKP